MYHSGKDKEGPRQAFRRGQGLGLAETKATRMLPDLMARVQHGMGHVQSSCSCSEMFGCSESLQVDRSGGVIPRRFTVPSALYSEQPIAPTHGNNDTPARIV